jgi:DNA-binding transcriptional MerR regulator
MRIGELADHVGVNPKTIRYYESIGLLPEPARTDGGYRLYDAADVDRLLFIRRAQRLDLSLDEIAEILAMRERGEQPCSYVVSAARTRLDELDRRIADMQQVREELHALLQGAEDGPAGAGGYCHLIEHERKAQGGRRTPPPPAGGRIIAADEGDGRRE